MNEKMSQRDAMHDFRNYMTEVECIWRLDHDPDDSISLLYVNAILSDKGLALIVNAAGVDRVIDALGGEYSHSDAVVENGKWVCTGDFYKLPPIDREDV